MSQRGLKFPALRQKIPTPLKIKRREGGHAG